MPILFDGPLPVAYGQGYLTSRELPDMDRAFAGQANDVLGAGVYALVSEAIVLLEGSGVGVGAAFAPFFAAVFVSAAGGAVAAGCRRSAS